MRPLVAFLAGSAGVMSGSITIAICFEFASVPLGAQIALIAVWLMQSLAFLLFLLWLDREKGGQD